MQWAQQLGGLAIVWVALAQTSSLRQNWGTKPSSNSNWTVPWMLGRAMRLERRLKVSCQLNKRPSVDNILFSVLAPEVLAGRCPRPCNECTKTQIKRVMAELSQRFPRRFQEMMRQLAPQRGWPALLVLYSNTHLAKLQRIFQFQDLCLRIRVSCCILQ